MGITYDNDFYDDKPLAQGEPLRFPRIGYDNVITEQNVVGSSSLAGFPAESVGNALTYELWKPATLPAALDIDAGEPVTADYVAFGAHNLSGCQITLSYSADGSTYTPAIEGVVIRNKAGMMLFEPVTARYWRLDILGWATSPTLDLDFSSQTYAVGDYTDADDTYLGVLYLGRALQMQRGIYQGHTPGEFARNDEIRPSVSEGGQWLGRTVIRKGYDTTYSFSNLKADWVRSTLAPFLDAAITDPFFIAWRPETKADEVLFGWSNSPIVPTNSGPRDYMSVDFNVSAHGETPVTGKFEAESVFFDQALSLTRNSEATYFDAGGVLRTAAVDEPRFTHDPVTGEALGLLIEEQRTNLCPYSEDFTQARQSGVTIEPFTSIFGTTNSAVFAADGTTKYVFYDVPLTAGVEYVLTAYVIMDDGGAPSFGSVSGSSPTNSLAVIIANGSASELLTAELVNADLNIYKVTGKRTSPITGNESAGIYKYSSNDSRGFRLLALQVEQGSFPTSYIKTEGSQVTREADNCSRTLGAEFNSSEGTFVAVYRSFKTTGLGWIFETNNRSPEVFYDAEQGIVILQASGIVPVITPVVLEDQNKIAVSVHSDRTVLFAVNGTVSVTQNINMSGDSINLGQNGSNPNRFLDGELSSFEYYPRALSAEELQTLTAPEV